MTEIKINSAISYLKNKIETSKPFELLASDINEFLYIVPIKYGKIANNPSAFKCECEDPHYKIYSFHSFPKDSQVSDRADIYICRECYHRYITYNCLKCEIRDTKIPHS